MRALAIVATLAVCAAPIAAHADTGYSNLFTIDLTGTVVYVALGDSYSSGEGAGDYELGTDEYWNDDDDGNGFFGNRCHRSANAYSRSTSPFVEAYLGNDVPVGRSSFFACSGAVTQNVSSAGYPRFGEIPQLDNPEVGPDVDLITLTIGGNDALFASIILWCLEDGPCADFEPVPGHPLIQTLPLHIQQNVESLLVDLFEEAKLSAPNATVLVL